MQTKTRLMRILAPVVVVVIALIQPNQLRSGSEEHLDSASLGECKGENCGGAEIKSAKWVQVCPGVHVSPGQEWSVIWREGTVLGPPVYPNLVIRVWRRTNFPSQNEGA